MLAAMNELQHNVATGLLLALGVAIIALVLFVGQAPARADIVNAWECDNEISVKLHRLAVHPLRFAWNLLLLIPQKTSRCLCILCISRIMERPSVISISSLPHAEQSSTANAAESRA
jgi:hypothetical protein